MATSLKALFRGPATTTTSTTLYTVPAATTSIVTNIAISNTSGTDATFTVALAGQPLHSAASISANSTAYIDLKQVLSATETITGGASSTDVIIHISGAEVS